MAHTLENNADFEAVPRERVTVAIVGAGPVGLTLGLGLSRYGIASIILDDDDKLSEGSRSICVQRHTLQIFERLGVVGPMMAKGVTWQVGRVFFGQREIFQIRFPGSQEKFPPFINLPQYYVEQYLVDALKQQSLADLRWKHKVVDLNQKAQTVEVWVETPQGQRIIEADYVLGADGARSQVRRLLNLDFVGKTYRDRFLIVDVRAELDFPAERWFWFDPNFNKGKSALLHPQPEGVWRIDWQLGPDIDIEAETQPLRLAKRIEEVIGERPYEIVWQSIYTFHQRHAQKFKQGRIFLLGDAAHIMSPFGARGMNSGVQDANNLLWKLALVLDKRAPATLLDTYESERHAAALENLHITDKSMAFITPHTMTRLWLRNLILRGSVHFKRIRKLVNSGRLSSPYIYRQSVLLDKSLHLPSLKKLIKSSKLTQAAWRFRQGPKVGSVAPDAFYTLPDASQTRLRLLDLVGQEFVILYFENNSQAIAALQEALKMAPNLPIQAYIIRKAVGTDTCLPPNKEVKILWDETGELAKTYKAQPGTFYVIRPDGHIAAKGLEFSLARLTGILRAAAGLPG